MRLRISPAQPAIHCVTRAEDGCCLLIRNLVGNQIGCGGIHWHVLGMSALCFNACALQIGTEHSAATLAPFASSTRGLNPGGTHAVPHLSRGDVGGHGNNLADRLVAEDSGEWSGQVSKRLVYVGIADAACMHLHEHLIGSGLRLRNIFDLPRTAHSGNNRSLHKRFLLTRFDASSLPSLHDFGSPKLTLTRSKLSAIRNCGYKYKTVIEWPVPLSIAHSVCDVPFHECTEFDYLRRKLFCRGC